VDSDGSVFSVAMVVVERWERVVVLGTCSVVVVERWERVVVLGTCSVVVVERRGLVVVLRTCSVVVAERRGRVFVDRWRPDVAEVWSVGSLASVVVAPSVVAGAAVGEDDNVGDDVSPALSSSSLHAAVAASSASKSAVRFIGSRYVLIRLRSCRPGNWPWR